MVPMKNCAGVTIDGFVCGAIIPEAHSYCLMCLSLPQARPGGGAGAPRDVRTAGVAAGNASLPGSVRVGD